MTASLAKTIHEHPAIGWVRADQAAATQLLTELNDLRKRSDEVQKENAKLRKERDELVRARDTYDIENLAGLDEEVALSGVYKNHKDAIRYRKTEWTCHLTWLDLFCMLAPEMMHSISSVGAKFCLQEKLGKHSFPVVSSASLDDEMFHTIKLQFLAHRLIECPTAGRWVLTAKGKQIMFKELTIKKGKARQESANPA